MRLMTKPNLLLEVQEATTEDISNTIEYLKQNQSLNIANTMGDDSIDCCGTGGSGTSKFNYSTATAFILNAAGARVVKFGNRAQTSKSGSIDFLEALGIQNKATCSQIERVFEKTNLAFLNALDFYPQLKNLRAQRKALKKPTILNYIGPLLNPAKPEYRLLGISNLKMMDLLKNILSEDPRIKRAILALSKPNLDELSVKSMNHCIQIDNIEKTVKHSQFEGSTYAQLKGNSLEAAHTPQANVLIFENILNGYDTNSEIYQNLVLNAAHGILVLNKAESTESAIKFCQELIKEGYVKNSLCSIRRALNEYS